MPYGVVLSLFLLCQCFLDSFLLRPYDPKDIGAIAEGGHVFDAGNNRHGLPVEADESGMWERCRHPLKGNTDDAGRVEAYVKFLKHQLAIAMCLHKLLLAFGLTVPTAYNSQQC